MKSKREDVKVVLPLLQPGRRHLLYTGAFFRAMQNGRMRCGVTAKEAAARAGLGAGAAARAVVRKATAEVPGESLKLGSAFARQQGCGCKEMHRRERTRIGNINNNGSSNYGPGTNNNGSSSGHCNNGSIIKHSNGNRSSNNGKNNSNVYGYNNNGNDNVIGNISNGNTAAFDDEDGSSVTVRTSSGGPGGTTVRVQDFRSPRGKVVMTVFSVLEDEEFEDGFSGGGYDGDDEGGHDEDNGEEKEARVIAVRRTKKRPRTDGTGGGGHPPPA